MSSNRDVSSSSSECRANIYEATGGTAGQMERREYVSLIDVVGAEAGSVGGVECVERCQNHRHICCSSPAFPLSFKCFLPPCKVYRAATTGWRVLHKRLLLLFFFSLPFHKLPKRATKEKGAHSGGRHPRNQANKSLLMCAVTQPGRKMPSAHTSTQLLRSGGI